MEEEPLLRGKKIKGKTMRDKLGGKYRKERKEVSLQDEVKKGEKK